MIILPAIDLIDKTPVRLVKGDFDTAHVVAQSAIDTAKSFKNDGATYIHVVDLDGARKGVPCNLDVALDIKRQTGMFVEFGGGVRDLATVELLAQEGIDRIVLGSVALKNKSLVVEAVKHFGSRIGVGIDAKNGFVSTQGWLSDSTVNYIDFAKEMEQVGVDTIIYTDIGRDGTLTGPNLEQLGSIAEAVSCKIIASGGVKDIADIAALLDMGLYGAIAGKSLYSGTLALKDAIRCAGAQTEGA